MATSKVLQHFGSLLSGVRLDKSFLPQERLDLPIRERTSFYPWRGQFSPGLVEALLDAYAGDRSVVLDPFMGSGTTLFEATRKNLQCYGIEVNPAAVYLASMAEFSNVSAKDRRTFLARAEELIEDHLAFDLPASLFRPLGGTANTPVKTRSLRALIRSAASNSFVERLLVTTLMLGMKDAARLSGEAWQDAFSRTREIVYALPSASNRCQAIMGDARHAPLPAGSISLVITSPPYINVFNYHQNYRPAMELFGWNLLEIARSEIGSNRKHRGNRFLTVVQYCIDLAETLKDLRRVLRPDGIAVFVIGRQSQVRGVPFCNGEILVDVAINGAGFMLDRWQERRFTNRFGELIYEDILSFRAAEQPRDGITEYGRLVGRLALAASVKKAPRELRPAIEEAYENGEEVQASPLLNGSKMRD